MAKLETRIHNIVLKNPVMTASGTFGYGEEFADFIDLSRLGGIIVKGTTGERRQGNAYPRMAETPAGMLNAVGLQNVGVETFCNEVYPRIKDIDTQILVNVSGSSIEEYCRVAEMIDALQLMPYYGSDDLEKAINSSIFTILDFFDLSKEERINIENMTNFKLPPDYDAMPSAMRNGLEDMKLDMYNVDTFIEENPNEVYED